MQFHKSMVEDARATGPNQAHPFEDHPDTPNRHKPDPQFLRVPCLIQHRGPRAFVTQALIQAVVLAAPVLFWLGVFLWGQPVDDPIIPYAHVMALTFVLAIALSGILLEDGWHPLESLRHARHARAVQDQRITAADAQETRAVLTHFEQLGIPYKALDRVPEELTNAQLSQLARALDRHGRQALKALRKGTPIAQAGRLRSV